MKIKMLIAASCVLAINTASAQGWRLYENVCTDAKTATGCTQKTIHSGDDWLNGANISPNGIWVAIATTEHGTGGAIKLCPVIERQGEPLDPCVTIDTWDSSDPQSAAFDDNGNGIVVTGKKGETAVGFYQNWKYKGRIRGWAMPFANAYITKSGRYIYAATAQTGQASNGARIYKFDMSKIINGDFNNSYSKIFDSFNSGIARDVSGLALDDNSNGYVVASRMLYSFENGSLKQITSWNIDGFMQSVINPTGIDMNGMNNLLMVDSTGRGGNAYYLSPLNTSLNPQGFEEYGYIPMSVMYGKFNSIFIVSTDGKHSQR